MRRRHASDQAWYASTLVRAGKLLFAVRACNYCLLRAKGTLRHADDFWIDVDINPPAPGMVRGIRHHYRLAER